MTENIFIQSLGLANLLSFGEGPVEIELRPLNVLIGPNASGKSNVLDAIGLLQSLPTSFAEAIRAGGGISEWINKGNVIVGDVDATTTPYRGIVRIDKVAQIWVTASYLTGTMPLRYQLCFAQTGQRTELIDESIKNANRTLDNATPVIFYEFRNGAPVASVPERQSDLAPGGQKNSPRTLQDLAIDLNQSILAQRKDPLTYPEITYLGEQFQRIQVFRDRNFGRDTPPRKPQAADAPEHILDESASNLSLVINDLQSRPDIKARLLKELRQFYETITDITTTIRGGTVQLYFHEKGLNSAIPATRMSDGTLRYLCLLAILLHPDPPPLVCIEEPELGMHPDILPEIARLLIEASGRMQLIVTTHSDILVNELSDIPESVVVCERQNGATTLRRLESERLKAWLENYSLGELWRSGELGANRW